MATQPDASPSGESLPGAQPSVPSAGPEDATTPPAPASADEEDAPEDDFLIQEEEELPVVRARPPELRAAPADFRNLKPRALGPPVPVEEANPEPEEIVPDSADPEGEPMAADLQAEAPPEGEAEPESPGEAAPEAEGEAETNAPEESPAEPVEIESADLPAAVPITPRRSSARVPVPLTTRQNLASMSARRLTQQVRTEAPPPPPPPPPPPAPARATTHYHPPFHPPGATPAPHPSPPPPKGLQPSWGLVGGAAAAGVVVGLVLAALPLRGALGLTGKSEANQRVQDVLEVERHEVGRMLNKTYVVNLKEEMRKFRGQQGSPTPENRDPKDLADEAAKIREEK